MYWRVLLFALLFIMAFGGPATAELAPVPIGAEAAFDAVQMQLDPISGQPARIALIDVRTRAEYVWVGAACQVDDILTRDGDHIVPDLGKVVLKQKGRILEYRLSGSLKHLEVDKVAKINLSPLAISIPYQFWNERKSTLIENDDFGMQVENLAEAYDVLIFFCRSGGRSEKCLADFDASGFAALYEIDQPDGKSGRGGFEGTSYSDVYNGYRGYPERLTDVNAHSSVAWKDAGLPIKTGLKP